MLYKLDISVYIIKIFAIYLWGIIPFGQGLTLADLSLGIFYTLALSSLGVTWGLI